MTDILDELRVVQRTAEAAAEDRYAHALVKAIAEIERLRKLGGAIADVGLNSFRDIRATLNRPSPLPSDFVVTEYNGVMKDG